MRVIRFCVGGRIVPVRLSAPSRVLKTMPTPSLAATLYTESRLHNTQAHCSERYQVQRERGSDGVGSPWRTKELTVVEVI